MSLETNLSAAKEAVAHVKGLGLKACNKLSDRIAAAGGVDNVIGTDQGLRTMNLGPAGTGVGISRTMPVGNYRSRAAHFASVGFGNCQEQAEIALVHLYDKGVRSLDLVSFSAATYDHVWVVVGLAAGAFGDNVRSWGADAVWCDPWQGDGVAFAIDDLVKGKVRNLNAIYKCDSLERIEAGLAISQARFA